MNLETKQQERPKSTQERAEEQLNKLAELFTGKNADKLPDLLKRTVIDSIGKPSENWSLNNQLLMQLQAMTFLNYDIDNLDEVDCRTAKQWNKEGRYINKGEKCRVVLTQPNFIKIKEENKKTGEEEERQILKGFKGFCVFDITQTNGMPLKEVKKPELPELKDVAEKWNIGISYKKIAGELGHYRPSNNTIVLGTEQVDVFFHELAHKAHERLLPDGQKLSQESEKYAEQEVIAQLSACVLSQIYNNCNVEKWTYDYITHYIESKEPEQVRKMIMRVFAMTGKVIKSIISAHEEKKEETTKK